MILRSLPALAGERQYRAVALHPGGAEKPLGLVKSGPETRLDVPLERGCALVKLSYLWLDPSFPCFVSSLPLRPGTTLRGAEIRHAARGGDLLGATSSADWQPWEGSLKLEKTTTVKLAAFVDGRMRGSALVRTFWKLPPPAPVAEPPGGIFTDKVAVRIAVPIDELQAAVRYTMDGSDPHVDSAAYTSPITVTDSTVLKARVIAPGTEPGAILTAVFSKLPPVPPAPDVPLGGLEPVSATVGWGEKARRDRSIQDKTLSIGGTSYARGMGVHARSELLYELKPEYRRFVAVVGVDDEMRGYDMASVAFAVQLDDRTIAESPVIRLGDRWHFDVEIPGGAKRIRLLVGDAGDGINADHADWAEAGFVVAR